MELGGKPFAKPGINAPETGTRVQISEVARGIMIQPLGVGCLVCDENNNPMVEIGAGDPMGLPYTDCQLIIYGDGGSAQIYITEFLDPTLTI